MSYGFEVYKPDGSVIFSADTSAHRFGVAADSFTLSTSASITKTYPDLAGYPDSGIFIYYNAFIYSTLQHAHTIDYSAGVLTLTSTGYDNPIETHIVVLVK